MMNNCTSWVKRRKYRKYRKK